MPRETKPIVWEPVSFPELVSRIGGGTQFTVDQLVKMIDSADKQENPFRLTHNDVNYEVSLGQIREYFTDHPRPTRNLTVAEENEALRARVKELEVMLTEAGIEPTRADLKPHPSFQPPFRQGRTETTAHPGPLAEKPVLEERKMSTSEIQDDLLSELRTKKPLTRDDPRVTAAQVK